jgi:hypothetical protein
LEPLRQQNQLVLDELNKFQMTSTLFTAPALLNGIYSTAALMDDGCNTYALIEQKLVQQAQLPWIQLPKPSVASSYNKYTAGTIREAAVIDSLDVGVSKAKQGCIFAYVVPKIEGEHGKILGRPWRRSEDVVIDPQIETLHIQRTGVIV